MTSAFTAGGPDILLDISRLLSRIRHHTPTGVDRVEMAYARGLYELVPERLTFAAVHPTGLYGRIPTETALRFIAATQEKWDGHSHRSMRQWHQLRDLWAMRPRSARTLLRNPIFLQASPHHLVNTRRVRDILKREHARFVCMLHDIIPITHPEYARPNGAQLHLSRIHTLVETADAVIANSAATLEAFQPYFESRGRPISTLIAHLGLDDLAGARVLPTPSARPYFVCLGTIEPRKNHLLLLHVWRDLAERYGAANVPRLLVIGRRGWENEQVVDMLERCPMLKGCVDEMANLRDGEVAAALAGARALLLPSFAEGFGMPVPEALAVGTPVICSDLPALREAGGTVPDYIDPLDGPAWRTRILDYVAPGSPARAAQIGRIATWRPTSWRDHLAKVLDLLHRLPA